MSDFVLDCSVSMAWWFDDEDNDYAEGVLDCLGSSQGMVPVVWPLEVANALLVAERRNRIDVTDCWRIVDLIGTLAIDVDAESPGARIGGIVNLARETGLSSYDAAYLELALRHGLPLATLDDRLRRAAQSSGVAIFAPG